LIYNPRNLLFQESRYKHLRNLFYFEDLLSSTKYNKADELDIMYMHVLLHGIGKQTRTIRVH